MCPSTWWITGENGLPIPNGRIIADTYESADKILFFRQLRGIAPMPASVIEESIDEVEDCNIISIEES